jgi:uncharacterized membrane protein
MRTIIELLIAVIFSSIGQVFWKLGMRDLGPIINYDLSIILKIFTNLFVDIGLLCYAISTIFWLISLSKEDLGYVYPFIAGTYILVLIFSWLILNESFGLNRSIGAVIVLLGLVVIIRGG